MTESTNFQTRQQQFSQRAYQQVADRLQQEKDIQEYKSFAKRFPTLIHTCGLAQSLSFAQAKGKDAYLADLAAVANMTSEGSNAIDSQARTAGLAEYMRLTRLLLSAANWLKRFSEALIPDQAEDEGASDASVP
ncbi:type III-B CRISPR module-associated protein Cmr5 [Teredinibacter turnerae]|uniref:type III-B CRISPR module-associated protein Cmr5 n=1 Tax=Teredinibacter turnerae TaxID=2426 RepID=UPI0030D01CF9